MNKYTCIKLITGVWLLSSVILSTGCADEHIESGPNANGKTASVTLDLLIPQPISSGQTTRAMGTDQEKAVKNIRLLVFEKTATAEVYRNIGEVTNTSNTQLTVIMPVTRAEYRFVVLANTPAQQIAEGTTKEEALNKFTFACSGIWATSGDASYIPMWGETNNILTIDHDKNTTIALHRALARVDVGLRFLPQTEDNQTEEVEGLDSFKISSVYVYRAKNKAYVATSSGKMDDNQQEVIDPNIPDDAKYNLGDGSSSDNRPDADMKPLVYELSALDDKYVREIYIPESIVLPSDSSSISMDDVPCLVIGGHYKNGEETFYRVDFANYKKEGNVSKVDSYKEILRNHRYVFDIRAVDSPGFKEPGQALNSITTPMEVNVAAWNDVPLNMYVQGDYFFQVEKREVWLEAVIPQGKQNIYEAIPYRTNIEIKTAPGHQPSTPEYVNVSHKWKSSGGEVSNAGFDGALYLEGATTPDSMIVPPNTIVAKIGQNNAGTNTPAEVRYDQLIVKVDNLQFTIDVYQKAANVMYDLECDKTLVYGKYRENSDLNYSHYLEVRIRPGLTGTNFENEIIEIVSEIRKGIYFEFKGTMTEGITNGTVRRNTDGTYTVKLQGIGAPVKDLNDRLNPDIAEGILTRIDKLKINTNSRNGSSCENTAIVFGYKSKRILTIGANAIYRFGYMLEPNSASRAFVDASVNFGIDPNSSVTMEQFPDDYSHSGNYPNKSDAGAIGNAFHIEYMTAGRGMSGESINMDYLNTMLNEFKPDIIITGQAINFSNDAITAISNFVRKGGVFLMFNEYYPSAASINKMAEAIVGTQLTGANEALSQSEFQFTLPVNGFNNDSILINVFGDLRGKTWGIDGYFLHGFSGLPLNDIIVYNTRKKDTNPCFFRHKTRPFVFIGDGGFISNAQRYIGPAYQGMSDYCPFAINSAYQPIERTNYTTSKFTVYNSRLFGNILAWAVDYGEFYGINRLTR